MPWKPNKFAGYCCDCKQRVEAGAGTLYLKAESGRRVTGTQVFVQHHVDTRWQVLCLRCAGGAPPPPPPPPPPVGAATN